jgi:hypothetical protein
MMNMTGDCNNLLVQHWQVATPKESKEDPSSHPLPAVPSDAEIPEEGFSRDAEESLSQDMANVSVDDPGPQRSRSLGSYERHTPDAALKDKNVAHPPSIYGSDEEGLLDKADHDSADSNLQHYSSSYGNRVINVNSHDANVVYSCNDSVLISRSLARIVIFYQLTIVIYRRILF